MIELTIGTAVFLLIQAFAMFFWTGRWMGRIDQKLKNLCNDTSHITADIQRIHQRLDEHGQRISNLEGRLGGS